MTSSVVHCVMMMTSDDRYCVIMMTSDDRYCVITLTSLTLGSICHGNFLSCIFTFPSCSRTTMNSKFFTPYTNPLDEECKSHVLTAEYERARAKYPSIVNHSSIYLAAPKQRDELVAENMAVPIWLTNRIMACSMVTTAAQLLEDSYRLEEAYFYASYNTSPGRIFNPEEHAIISGDHGEPMIPQEYCPFSHEKALPDCFILPRALKGHPTESSLPPTLSPSSPSSSSQPDVVESDNDDTDVYEPQSSQDYHFRPSGIHFSSPTPSPPPRPRRAPKERRLSDSSFNLNTPSSSSAPSDDDDVVFVAKVTHPTEYKPLSTRTCGMNLSHYSRAQAAKKKRSSFHPYE